MKKKPIALLYVCTRNIDFFFETLLKTHPVLYHLSHRVHNSSNALAEVPKAGAITVLTSNVFHGTSGELGVDGAPEKEMTGTKLAEIIKKKNPSAKVYLYSEKLTDSPIFDGVFKRDAINDTIPQDLQTLLDSVFVVPNQPYGTLRTLRDSLRQDKQHLHNAPLSAVKKKLLQQKIAENTWQVALLTRVLKIPK